MHAYPKWRTHLSEHKESFSFVASPVLRNAATKTRGVCRDYCRCTAIKVPQFLFHFIKRFSFRKLKLPGEVAQVLFSKTHMKLAPCSQIWSRSY
ncbi:hypothetical protein Y032_0193g1408 [Ancylostoma ceylanicum]|uniref:Uncharacterized protein n=1 Tax=Ancylostoma ceylanicum TaxID=53326 RepID=A0A016SPE0_9BILA|nr:hypothetical protein Y032_0193g1408 [Ancylostoma ceylanicum]